MRFLSIKARDLSRTLSDTLSVFHIVVVVIIITVTIMVVIVIVIIVIIVTIIISTLSLSLVPLSLIIQLKILPQTSPQVEVEGGRTSHPDLPPQTFPPGHQTRTARGCYAQTDPFW